MSDEKFEEFLQREAQAYNRPTGEVPRDAMWSAIAQARAARIAAGATPLPVIALDGTSRRKSRGLRYAPWIGMAATLLIGVGIGRFMLTQDAVSANGSGSAVAVAPVNGTMEAPAESVDMTPAPRMVAAGNSEAPVTARPARITTRSNPPGAARSPNEDLNGVDMTATPYRVVSQRHLASAEALISVVTSGPRDVLMDSLTSRWAREMLGNTRLLLDSPAGEDPLRRRLLEDLETLLVQLVQRSGAAVDERDLIDRTLQRTQLLTRLRTNSAGT